MKRRVHGCKITRIVTKRIIFSKFKERRRIRLLFRKVRAFFNPEQFQGWGKTRKYFEGWYFKVLNAEETKAFAFIPGLAMDAEGNRQAFIQVLDGKQKTAAYHRFEAKEFKPRPGRFFVELGANSFSDTHLQLDLPGLQGELQFRDTRGWPKPFYSPGIMGPYAFAPFMECYHGIVSMDHAVSGNLLIGEEWVSFDGGRGYTEKDWGRSFPSAYCWLQTNHFSAPGISLKASVAKIPWIRKSFTGFIAGLWLQDRLYRFTTYNRSVLRKCFINEQQLSLVMENPTYRLEIEASRDGATSLASPILGVMEGRIEESMTSTVQVQLTDKRKRRLILADTGRNTGLEVAGQVQEIMVP